MSEIDSSVTAATTCTKCGLHLPEDRKHFYAEKRKRNGLSSWCKDCVIAAAMDHWRQNRERGIATQKRRYVARRAEFVEKQAAYNTAHAEQIRDAARARRAADPDGCREAARQYRLEHKDRRRSYMQAYHSSHREDSRARAHRRRAHLLAAPGDHIAADVAAQYLRQHGRCYWCGQKVAQAYHVDHIVPLVRGGGNGPENLVIACPHCNASKHDKLPHEWSDRLC